MPLIDYDISKWCKKCGVKKPKTEKIRCECGCILRTKPRNRKTKNKKQMIESGKKGN